MKRARKVLCRIESVVRIDLPIQTGKSPLTDEFCWRVDIVNDNNGHRVRGRPGQTLAEARRSASWFGTRGSLRAIVVRCH